MTVAAVLPSGPATSAIYADYAPLLASLPCGDEVDYSSLRDAHLIHYPNDEDYDNFRGRDLLAEPPRPEEVPSSDGRPKAVLCGAGDDLGDGDAEDGTWRAQRIGPFRSTGGGDWWQFAYLDMFGLDGSLGEERRVLGKGGDVVVTAHWHGPVTAAGVPLGLPPLHVHHVHMTSEAGMSWSSDVLDCFVEGTNCPDGAIYFAHHGDGQEASAAEGGAGGASESNAFRPFGVDYGGARGKRVYGALSATGEVNDLRPADSEPIEWWYQTAVRLVTRQDRRESSPESSKALSVHYLYNPFEMGLDKQIARFGCYRVPPDRDSIHVYTGRMPFGGELAHAKSHTHMGVAQDMYLFEGSPEDLNLGGLQFERPWVPLDSVSALRMLGMGPEELELAEGAESDVIRELLVESVAEGPARLICASAGRRARVDGRDWDRSPTLDCGTWSFEAGTQYTSVAFNGNPQMHPDRDAPGLKYIAVSKLTKPFSSPPDYTFPQHSHWFLTYHSNDVHSRYTWAVGSRDPDAMSPVITKTDLARLLVWGTPKHAPGFVDNYLLLPTMNLALFILHQFHPTFTWFSPWPLGTAFALVAIFFLLLIAAFRAHVWLMRKPAVIQKVNRVSVRITGRLVMAASDPAAAARAKQYPLILEVVSYAVVSAAALAAIAAAVTATVPADVYLVNAHDQARIEEARAELQDAWGTGAPRDDGADARVIAATLALLLALGAGAYASLRLTCSAEATRRRNSVAIGNAQALQMMMAAAKEMEEEEQVELVEKCRSRIHCNS